MARLVCAAIVAVLVASASAARAQTTSAVGESLEVSGRAEELARAGEHARAAQVFRRALALDDDNARAHLGLSQALFALGRHREALEALRAAEAVLGWRADLAVQRANHLARLRQWQAALDAVTGVGADDDQAHLADRVRATAQLGLEQWEAAIVTLERYLRRRPAALRAADPFVRTRLAFALIHRGRYTRARRELGEVLTAAPRQLSARMLLFATLAKQGNCADALRLYGELERAIPSAPTLLYDAAVCHYRLGDGRRALALLDDYRARSRQPARALLLTARIHVALGDVARADAAYRAALDAGLPVEVELAQWLTKRGEHRAVADLLAPRAETGATDPELLYLAGDALRRVGALERAAAVSARLVELRPALRSWLLEGDIQLERAQWEAAERAFLAATAAAEPRNERAAAGLRTALEQRAHAAFLAGDRDGARNLLDRALAADDSADRAAYDLALLELARGDAPRAVALLDGRVARLASPAKGHLVLGSALARAGDPARARAELERVVADGEAPAALRARAASGLAALLASTAPERALDLVASARELGAGTAAERALASATSAAHLTLAERAYERDETKQLRAHLERADADALAPADRVRLGVLHAVADGREHGLAHAMRRLAAIPDDDLARAARDDLPGRALRPALALALGSRLVARASDYQRYLAGPAAALRGAADEGSVVAAQLLTIAYARLLDWALAHPAAGLARRLARDLPPAARTPQLELNAVLAASQTRAGHTPFGEAQVAQLERLSARLPLALLNLAIDAQQRGDEAAALAYLKRIAPDERTPEVREWIRWKELLHGRP